MKNDESGSGQPQVGSDALVRRCNRCNAITALDAEVANKADLMMPGQTVRVVARNEAMGKQVEACICTALSMIPIHLRPEWAR